MNRRLGVESKLGLGGGMVSEESRRNLDKAEKLCRMRKPMEAVPYLKKAMEDPNNLDADIQAAFLQQLPEAVKFLEAAEARGRMILKRVLGDNCFDDDGGKVGRFGQIIETKPYMRVLQALVRLYFENKRPKESLRTIVEMLRLCPGDNMAQRFWAGSMLSQSGRHADALFFAQQWLADHARSTGEPPLRGGAAFAPPSPAVQKPIAEDELKFISSSLLYSAALGSFKVYGDCEQSRTYLEMAAISNPGVLLKILANVQPPSSLNFDARVPNGAEDAQDYLFLTQNLWMEKDVWNWANKTHNAKKSVLKRCSRTSCSEMEKHVAEYKRCSACHLVSYCSPSCQKLDWPHHKKACQQHKTQKASLRAFQNGKALPEGAPLMFASDMGVHLVEKGRSP